jgi:hypothetical protein
MDAVDKAGEEFVPVKTNEEYRLTLVSKGRRYKAFSHAVREDETLQIRFSSHLRPQNVFTGELARGDNGLAPVGGTDEPSLSAVKALHYHPSGQINLKRDGTVEPIKQFRTLPFQLLTSPTFLYGLSPSTLDQLTLDQKQTKPADAEISLDDLKLKRISVEVWVGPKGSFKNIQDQGPHAIARAVYEDATLYDVCYKVTEAPPIDSSVIVKGARLECTCIRWYLTGAPPESLKSVPDLPAEQWSSPPAVARQIRAFLEHSTEQLRQRIGALSGGRELRLSLCRTGAVASVDWGNDFVWSFQRCENLTPEDILKVLGWRPDGMSKIKDVADIDAALTGGIREAVFVRARPRNSMLHNAIVFNAIDPPTGSRPYWRIPPAALIEPSKIIKLIPPKIGAALNGGP